MSAGNRPLILQLGRVGDILNSLPLAKKIFDETGERPLYMTAKEFAPILEGVSYLEPVLFDGDWMDFIPAMFQARRLTKDVRVAQICGKGLVNRPTCSSFARESWTSANAGVPWGSLPLVIDRRNRDREADAIRRVGVDPKRKLVLLATSGISSPFMHSRRLREELARQLPAEEFQVVDLDPLRFPRFYDLLGLLELAHCLVTVDTAPLHLAHACDVPVVAIVNDLPSEWHGSPWRPNQIGRFFYREFPGAIDGVVERVRNARNAETLPRIVHVWADFRHDERPDHENLRRMANARASWAEEYRNAGGRWLNVELPMGRVRTSREFGDPRPVPFIADLVNHGVPYCRKDSDVICWTNADVSFAPGLTGHALDKCRMFGAAFTHRWDFHKLSKPFVTEAMVRRGKWYPGSDAFFMTLGWWKRFGHEYPDMIMGREHNDEILRMLMKLRSSVDCEIEAAIYHEKHASFWESPENFETNEGNRYNRKLAREFYAKHELGPGDYKSLTKPVDRETR